MTGRLCTSCPGPRSSPNSTKLVEGDDHSSDRLSEEAKERDRKSLHQVSVQVPGDPNVRKPNTTTRSLNDPHHQLHRQSHIRLRRLRRRQIAQMTQPRNREYRFRAGRIGGYCQPEVVLKSAETRSRKSTTDLTLTRSRFATAARDRPDDARRGPGVYAATFKLSDRQVGSQAYGRWHCRWSPTNCSALDRSPSAAQPPCARTMSPMAAQRKYLSSRSKTWADQVGNRACRDDLFSVKARHCDQLGRGPGLQCRFYRRGATRHRPSQKRKAPSLFNDLTRLCGSHWCREPLPTFHCPASPDHKYRCGRQRAAPEPQARQAATQLSTKCRAAARALLSSTC